MLFLNKQMIKFKKYKRAALKHINFLILQKLVKEARTLLLLQHTIVLKTQKKYAADSKAKRDELVGWVCC